MAIEADLASARLRLDSSSLQKCTRAFSEKHHATLQFVCPGTVLHTKCTTWKSRRQTLASSVFSCPGLTKDQYVTRNGRAVTPSTIFMCIGILHAPAHACACPIPARGRDWLTNPELFCFMYMLLHCCVSSITGLNCSQFLGSIPPIFFSNSTNDSFHRPHG